MKNICLAIVEILFFHIRWIKFFAQTSSYLWCEIEHSMQFLFPWQLFGLRFEVLSIYCSKNWIRTVRLYVNEIMWFDRLLICCLWIVHAIWAVTLFDFANFFPNFICYTSHYRRVLQITYIITSSFEEKNWIWMTPCTYFFLELLL